MAGSEPGEVGQALVDFALNGAFPEEPLSSGRITLQELRPALEALAKAKAGLEVGSICYPGQITASQLFRHADLTVIVRDT